LIKQRQRVTHAALRGAGNRRRSRRRKREALGGRNLAQTTTDQLRAHRPKLELLAAREDGGRNLEAFGRGKYPEDVRGGLLDCLEKRVEGRFREHVNLVHNDDPEPVPGRMVAKQLLELTDVINAGVGGRIHLNHVEARSVCDFPARDALAAGLGGRSLRTVDGLGEQPCGGGLANAP